MGPIGCPETSVRKYHYSLRNNPEGRGFLGIYKVHVMRFADMMYFLPLFWTADSGQSGPKRVAQPQFTVGLPNALWRQRHPVSVCNDVSITHFVLCPVLP